MEVSFFQKTQAVECTGIYLAPQHTNMQVGWLLQLFHKVFFHLSQSSSCVLKLSVSQHKKPKILTCTPGFGFTELRGKCLLCYTTFSIIPISGHNFQIV